MAISKQRAGLLTFLFAIGLFAIGCANVEGTLADEIVDAPDATGTGFFDPERATNGVRGGGDGMQSLDVYSISPRGYLVLGWSGQRVVDGPGDDLALFENPFRYGDGRVFIDPAIVEVSADGSSWATLAHDYVAGDETQYSASTEDWIGFGGVHPVHLHADSNPVDPFSDEAGGDRFDLANLTPGDEADRVLREGARYVRIVPAPSRTNPDTGAPFPQDPIGDGPDIDGLFARYLEAAP